MCSSEGSLHFPYLFTFQVILLHGSKLKWQKMVYWGKLASNSPSSPQEVITFIPFLCILLELPWANKKYVFLLCPSLTWKVAPYTFISHLALAPLPPTWKRVTSLSGILLCGISVASPHWWRRRLRVCYAVGAQIHLHNKFPEVRKRQLQYHVMSSPVQT